MNPAQPASAPHLRVEPVAAFSGDDLHNLVRATQEAIAEGIGFNWIAAPAAETLESYWNGVLLVPGRHLIGAWLDGNLCASLQLVRPARSKETSFFAVGIEAQFVAPFARGHGLARRLLATAEHEAAREGFSVVRLSVRETQEAAIRLYEESGYHRWGTLPFYEYVAGQTVAGHFFYKRLEAATAIA